MITSDPFIVLQLDKESKTWNCIWLDRWASLEKSVRTIRMPGGDIFIEMLHHSLVERQWKTGTIERCGSRPHHQCVGQGGYTCNRNFHLLWFSFTYTRVCKEIFLVFIENDSFVSGQTVTAAEEGFASAEALHVYSFWALTAQQLLPAEEVQVRWQPGRDQTQDPCCPPRGVARRCTSPVWGLDGLLGTESHLVTHQVSNSKAHCGGAAISGPC